MSQGFLLPLKRRSRTARAFGQLRAAIRRAQILPNPDILVCLGQPATQTLLATREGITKTRGRWFKYDTGSREIRALAMTDSYCTPFSSV